MLIFACRLELPRHLEPQRFALVHLSEQRTRVRGFLSSPFERLMGAGPIGRPL